jgi:hypothetical protein
VAEDSTTTTTTLAPLVLVEYPLRIRVQSGADWLDVFFPAWIVWTTHETIEFEGTGGASWNWSPAQSDYAGAFPAYLSLGQPLSDAQAGSTVTLEIEVSAAVAELIRSEIILYVDGGCIGTTDVKVYDNAGSEPILAAETSVRTCDGTVGRIPLRIPTADLTPAS